MGNLNRSCYVCLAEYTFYLVIWGYLKQTVHFREQLTLKNRSTKKPRSLSYLWRKKETIKSGTRVGISNAILVPGTGFERTNLQKFKCQGGCWSFKLIDAFSSVLIWCWLTVISDLNEYLQALQDNPDLLDIPGKRWGYNNAFNFQSIQNTSMPIDLIDSDSGLPIALVSYLLILMIVKRILPIITRGNV